MSADAATMARVLDAAHTRGAELGPDELLVFDVMPGAPMRVLVGDRTKMRAALLAQGILDATAAHFLAHRAPPRFAWLVVAWDDAVSTLLVSVDQPEADRRAN